MWLVGRRNAVFSIILALLMSTVAASPAYAALGAPYGFTATTDSRGLGVSLQWNVVSNAVSYRVYRSTTSIVTPSSTYLLDTVSGTRYRDTTSTMGKTLKYIVTAVDNSGAQGEASIPVSVTASDELRLNRTSALSWLECQQLAAERFRVNLNEAYSTSYTGLVSGGIGDIAQLEGSRVPVPAVTFSQAYGTSYVGPTSGRWFNVNAAQYRVDVYSVADIEYLQGRYALSSNGTWSSGSAIARQGTKVAKLVNTSTGAVVATSGGGSTVIQGVQVAVYSRADIDYLQQVVPLYGDGTWRTTHGVGAGTKIVRLIRASDNRVLGSSEWNDVSGYQGLLRSFHIPQNDLAYGADSEGARPEQRTGVYDDAVAAFAFTTEGRYDQARAVLNQLSVLQAADDSLAFSYDVNRAMPMTAYQRTGSIAWVGIAAVEFEIRTGDTSFRPFAERLANYVLRLQVTSANGYAPNDARYGSVLGGRGRYTVTGEYVDELMTFASTEHNIDAYFFLRDLGYLTGSQTYATASNLVKQSLLTHHWNTAEGRFDQGVGDTSKALDTASWGGLFLLAIGDQDKAAMAARYLTSFRVENSIVGLSADPTTFNQTYSSTTPINGYKPYLAGGQYTSPPNTVWAEGTWGALLFRLRLGEDVQSDLGSMQALQQIDPQHGYLQVTSAARVSPYEFSVWPAVGSTAWASIVMADASALWRPDGWRK